MKGIPHVRLEQGLGQVWGRGVRDTETANPALYPSAKEAQLILRGERASGPKGSGLPASRARDPASASTAAVGARPRRRNRVQRRAAGEGKALHPGRGARSELSL